MSVVTAIVARHPETYTNVHPQTMEAIESQFSVAMERVGADALKTGMLFSKEVIERVAELLKQAKVNNIVVDPVMVGKLDSKLLRDNAIQIIKEKLIPLATIITPNIPEASILLDDRPLRTIGDLKQAAIDLQQLGSQFVLVKGGRLEGPAIDVLFDGSTCTTFEAPRIDTVNTSGAGCSYSAAIAAYLAKGETVFESVRLAKEFITTAIEYGFSYGESVGPTYHAAKRKKGVAHQIKIN